MYANGPPFLAHERGGIEVEVEIEVEVGIVGA